MSEGKTPKFCTPTAGHIKNVSTGTKSERKGRRSTLKTVKIQGTFNVHQKFKIRDIK